MKRYILVTIAIALGLGVKSQVLPKDTTLIAYSGQTSIQALNSITLKNGFHIPVQAGKAVTISIVGFQNLISQPTVGQNYILTKIFKKPGVTLTTLNAARTIGEENQSIQYFDGLGRLIQKVELMASPNYKDIVQHIEYDAFGRENIKYLPYAESTSGNGSYKIGAKNNLSNYYKKTSWDDHISKTDQPYSVTVFENSPFGRIEQQGAPGIAWQPVLKRETVLISASTGHTVASEYGTNLGSDVKLWAIKSTNNGATSSFYEENKLYKTVYMDENWVKAKGKQGTVEEYKDFEGRVVLKRIWETDTKKLETYYVYDDFGNLRYVIPPGYTTPTITDNDLDFNELIYAYRYDSRQRQIEKKIPGKGWEWLVYNSNDKVIMTQDSVQRGKSIKEWNYTKYDIFGRIVGTGIYKRNYANQSEAQKSADSIKVYWEERSINTKMVGTNQFTKYTENAFPKIKNSITPLTVNYYDDYLFEGADTIKLAPFEITKSTKTKGLATGIKVYKDDGTMPLLSISYYDDYERVIQNNSQNHLLGTDLITNKYNFAGELLSSKREHRPTSGKPTIILTTNSYDHVGRAVHTKKRVNDQNEIIQSKLSYNEIGQLKNKDIHSENGNNYLSSISYTYNERGWVNKSSAPQFTYELNYNQNSSGNTLTNAQYNGNIAEQLWNHIGEASNTFVYNYDGLNRLKNGTSVGMSESLTYDNMGNIKTLTRNNSSTTYTYNNSNKSNKLLSLSGGLKGTFTYDGNGNATKDRTGMTFSYNQLDLPKSVISTSSARTITYLYDALGNKLKKKATVGSVITEQDYLEGIEYSKLGSDLSKIERIATEDGFLLNSNGIYSYYYNLTDHLGNVRSLIKRAESATVPQIVQKQDYYPFGKMKSIATSINNKYLYNGKEMQEDLNLGSHTLGSSYVFEGQSDFGARFYDAEIGRWNVLDPKAEMFFGLSSYLYSFNNPVNFEDMHGMAPDQGGNTDPTKLYGKRIDMTNAPAGSKVNAAGFVRDGPWFWKQMLNKYPEMFNNENRVLINTRISPRVNDQWIKYNPTHAEYKDGRLIHHHIDQANMATGIPEKAHRKFTKNFHPNNGKLKGGLGKINNVLGVSLGFLDIFSSIKGDPHSLGMQFSAGTKLNTLYYDDDKKKYYEISKRIDVKNTQGEVIGKKVTYTTYEDYRQNESTGKYEGVNKLEQFDAVIYQTGESSQTQITWY